MCTEIFQVKGEEFQKRNLCRQHHASSKVGIVMRQQNRPPRGLAGQSNVKAAVVNKVCWLTNLLFARPCFKLSSRWRSISTLVKICCRRRCFISGQGSGNAEGDRSVGMRKALNFTSKISRLPDAAWTHPSAAGHRQLLRTTAMDGTNGGTALSSTKALCPQFTLTISFPSW